MYHTLGDITKERKDKASKGFTPRSAGTHGSGGEKCSTLSGQINVKHIFYYLNSVVSLKNGCRVQ